MKSTENFYSSGARYGGGMRSRRTPRWRCGRYLPLPAVHAPSGVNKWPDGKKIQISSNFRYKIFTDLFHSI